jgi:competence protein ComEA
MIRRISAVVILLLLGFFMQSCGRTKEIYLEQGEGISSETEWAETDNHNSEEYEPVTLGEQDFSGVDMPEEIFVYVCGAVAQAGVYELQAGARIYEAIEMAGGFLEDACPEAVNLAGEAYDAQMIWIPTVSEAAEEGLLPAKDGTMSENGTKEADDRINLNTATAAQLMTLPGIGQSKADSIIAYRDSHGGFASIEDIMNVDGIKEGVYNRIKDNIKVN